MNEPWFNPNLYAWIPGTLLGFLGGTIGGLAGWLAPKGRGKALVLGGMGLLIGYSAVMLAIGVFAFLTGQPYGIWYGFGLAGVIGLLVLGINYPVVRKRYREAEERRMNAQDVPL
jgi:MFS family permease